MRKMDAMKIYFLHLFRTKKEQIIVSFRGTTTRREIQVFVFLGFCCVASGNWQLDDMSLDFSGGAREIVLYSSCKLN